MSGYNMLTAKYQGRTFVALETLREYLLSLYEDGYSKDHSAVRHIKRLIEDAEQTSGSKY